MEAMEFFQRSEGKWLSQRATHHLPFRRTEMGDSEITVETLPADHPKVIEICQLHEVEPNKAAGGAFVRWHGSMAWDKEDENHEGSTVFAIVPDSDNPRQGQMLRERGYAEIVPVAGRYLLDEDNALTCITRICQRQQWMGVIECLQLHEKEFFQLLPETSGTRCLTSRFFSCHSLPFLSPLDSKVILM